MYRLLYIYTNDVHERALSIEYYARFDTALMPVTPEFTRYIQLNLYTLHFVLALSSFIRAYRMRESVNYIRHIINAREHLFIVVAFVFYTKSRKFFSHSRCTSVLEEEKLSILLNDQL